MRLLLRQRLDAPSLCFGLTAAAYLVFLLMRLRAHGYDPSYFVTAGDQFVDVARVPGSLSVLKNSSGYDGQFYYRLALDPFTGRQSMTPSRSPPNSLTQLAKIGSTTFALQFFRHAIVHSLCGALG